MAANASIVQLAAIFRTRDPLMQCRDRRGDARALSQTAADGLLGRINYNDKWLHLTREMGRLAVVATSDDVMDVDVCADIMDTPPHPRPASHCLRPFKLALSAIVAIDGGPTQTKK